MSDRDTLRYHLKKPGGQIVHRRITSRSIEERYYEHQRNYGDVYIVKVGVKVSRESALRWEREGGKRV